MKEKHKQMYMRQAFAAAETSSAIRLQVGAVAINPRRNQLIASGYNALPSGVDGECETKIYLPPDAGGWIEPQEIVEKFPFKDDIGRYYLKTRPEVRHGEKNLLLNLAKSTESAYDSHIFCTHSCCLLCAMDIVDSGCSKFYYKHHYRDTSGLDYLLKNGVEVEQIN